MKEKNVKTKEKKKVPSAVQPSQVVKAKPGQRKVLVGTVASDKMNKTIVVKVNRKVRHDLYKKYVVRTQKFKAHDEKNEGKVGDLVEIVESRPLSKDKRWALVRIVRKSTGPVVALADE